jgi:hypothetical protein
MAKEFECEREEVVVRDADGDELVAKVERLIAEPTRPGLEGLPRRASSGPRREA